MKIVKRCMAAILCLVMLMGMMPANILAADEVASGTCGENLTWSLDDEGILTISGTGDMIDYSNENNAPWYSYDNFERVVVEEGVTSIGDFAFYCCYGMTSVTLPESLMSIGDYAFYYCIGITDITFSESLVNIGDYAFGECYGIKSIFIPESVTNIGECAYFECFSLTEILVSNENEHYKSIDGVLFDKEGALLIQYPVGNMRSIYIVPYGVIEIGDFAFFQCSELTNLTISAGVKKVGNSALYGCSGLSCLTIPKSITYIDIGAFNYCESLIDVYYDGTENSWNNILIGECNESLLDANIHYIGIEMGDVNGDGETSNADLVIIARYIVGADTSESIAQYGDMNNDGLITNADLVMLARIIVGLE